LYINLLRHDRGSDPEIYFRLAPVPVPVPQHAVPCGQTVWMPPRCILLLAEGCPTGWSRAGNCRSFNCVDGFASNFAQDERLLKNHCHVTFSLRRATSSIP
jgi:hypothetical protein